MLKAIFFDMDETLCATSEADNVACLEFAQWCKHTYPSLRDEQRFAQRYLLGVYKKLNNELTQLVKILPDERAYRHALIDTLMAEQGVKVDSNGIRIAQHYFDQQRMAAFDFFPGVNELLVSLKTKYKLVVITNGPSFSQHQKLSAVSMSEYVDHIIVGGDEPEQKPAPRIFQKALDLVDARPDEVIHVGDSLDCDIVGANNMGIASVWVDGLAREEDPHITPDFRVRSVTELPKILRLF